jgi:hypothetical protein
MPKKRENKFQMCINGNYDNGVCLVNMKPCDPGWCKKFRDAYEDNLKGSSQKIDPDYEEKFIFEKFLCKTETNNGAEQNDQA